MFSSDNWFGAGVSQFYNGVATQSLRLDSASTSYLYDTASGTESSTANRAISFWFKRSQVDVAHTILTGFVSGPVVKDFIQFRSDNTLRVLVQQSSASNQTRWTTDQVFRDTSAWYHIFIKYALGESSNADKVKIYVNGSLVGTDGGVATGANVTSSQLLTANTTIRIGTYSNATLTVNGYLSEFNLIDGTADVDDFGELKNSVWIPIEYTGSYGNSGFRLEFNQTGTGTASDTTIGADTSGNNKHFDSSGIDTEDCNMPDSPENGFATICPLSSSPATFSEGNLKFNGSNLVGNTNQGISSGKFYAEVYVNAGSNWYVGVLDISRGLNPNRGGSWTSTGTIAYKANGDQYSLPLGGSSSTASYGASYSTGDIIGIAVDVDSDTITFYKNGVSQGNTTNGVSHISSDGVYGVLIYGTSSTLTVNFGQDPSFAGALTGGDIGTETPSVGAGVFKYAVPSGFKALCTANISDDDLAISPNADTQAQDHFDSTLWVGNESTRSIEKLSFKPDWVWIKQRDTENQQNVLQDSTRGAGEHLYSNLTNSEATATGSISSFDAPSTADATDGGWTMGANLQINRSGRGYVGWSWKANGGTTSSNDSGSIISTVQANTDAGFSIVSYTGNSTIGATVGHGLGTTPELIIFKNRDDGTAGFPVYAEPIGATQIFYLSLGNAATASDAHVNNTAPSPTVITLHDHVLTNKTSDRYIAYCFASIEGYSKIGTFSGNADAGGNGTFAWCGFRPAFIMVKNTSVTQSWRVWDTTRNPTNETNLYLTPNGNGQEGSTSVSIDILSNGFKPRGSNASMNGSGNTMLYIAFAESPFKYANGR